MLFEAIDPKTEDSSQIESRVSPTKQADCCDTSGKMTDVGMLVAVDESSHVIHRSKSFFREVG
jgi:hypothetical protein